MNENEVVSTREAEIIIGEEYRKTGDYSRMYHQYDKLAQYIWNATERPGYEADMWYNLNRNEICLEMLGDLCIGKRVISVAGGQWVEGRLLLELNAGEKVRTDIVGNPEEGIIEARADKLPYPNGSFDVAICREVMEHVPDDQAVFKELNRVLKVGGLLLITTPNSYTMMMDGTFHVRLYTPFGLLDELDSHGFSILKKRGNLPYMISSLLTLSDKGYTNALEDYKKLEEITKGYEDRYYIGTQMFVLAKKERSEDTVSCT
jgi:SAM-dependent methyltransferase